MPPMPVTWANSPMFPEPHLPICKVGQVRRSRVVVVKGTKRDDAHRVVSVMTAQGRSAGLPGGGGGYLSTYAPANGAVPPGRCGRAWVGWELGLPLWDPPNNSEPLFGSSHKEKYYICKRAVLPKISYSFSTVPINI